MEQKRKKLHHYNTPGHSHELTFSCYRRSDYFNDPVACEIFITILNESRELYNYCLWAYVIMPNHVHLLLWPRDSEYDIARIDSGIKGVFSKRYRKNLLEHNTSKHEKFLITSRGIKTFRFWQPGGGFDRNLWNSQPIHHSIKYIEDNPVRRGIVVSSEKYRWSSAWARKTNIGAVPDKFQLPVNLPNPQSQRIGVF